MADDPVPIPPMYDAQLAKIIAESARLKHQSADILKRIAELDEEIAACLPPGGRGENSAKTLGFLQTPIIKLLTVQEILDEEHVQKM